MKLASLLLVIGLCPALALAWQIGAKNRMSSAPIHSTYFLTPNNQPIQIRGIANMGYMNNGICDYSQGSSYSLGQVLVRTGDQIYIDAYRLLAMAGNAYTCIQITYTNAENTKQVFQPMQEWFQLVWNGMNYVNSFPAISQVTIP